MILFLQRLHIFSDLRICYPCIMLRGADIFVAAHLSNGVDGHPIAQGHRGR